MLVWQAKLWFSILDVASDGAVELCEFLRFSEVHSCPFKRSEFPKPGPQPIFKKLSIFCDQGVFLRVFPRVSASAWWHGLAGHRLALATFDNPCKIRRDADKADKDYLLNGDNQLNELTAGCKCVLWQCGLERAWK